MFHFETKQQRINRMIMRPRWNDTVMFSVMGSIRNKTKRIVLSVDDPNNTKYHNSIRRWGFKTIHLMRNVSLQINVSRVDVLRSLECRSGESDPYKLSPEMKSLTFLSAAKNALATT